MSCILCVDQSDVGRVIGKGGSFIRAFQESHDTKIDSINLAKRIPSKLVRPRTQRKMSCILCVDQSDVGRVIGKGGTFIRAFQDAHQTRIDIPKEVNRDGKIEISISGDQQSCDATADLIEGHLSGDRPFRPPRDDNFGGGRGGYGGGGGFGGGRGGGGYGGGGGGYGGGRGGYGGGGRGGGGFGGGGGGGSCYKCGEAGHFARECPNDGGGGGGGYGGGQGGGGGGRW